MFRKIFKMSTVGVKRRETLVTTLPVKRKSDHEYHTLSQTEGIRMCTEIFYVTCTVYHETIAQVKGCEKREFI